MVFFKILLIILVSAPVIALAWALYSQVVAYIKARNLAERKSRRGE